jgi:hypothetical protein
MKRVWRIWCRTLGQKISDDDREADIAAVLRSVWVVIHIATCLFIIINNGHNLKIW